MAVSIASFRRYVEANVPEETRRWQVKVLRPWPAEPGAEAQIDYGRLGLPLRTRQPASRPAVCGVRDGVACRRRLHSTLGYRTPFEALTDHQAAASAA